MNDCAAPLPQENNHSQHRGRSMDLSLLETKKIINTPASKINPPSATNSILMVDLKQKELGNVVELHKKRVSMRGLMCRQFICLN